ncbi:MAG: hypothetical protein JWM25_1576 [Thermoleophilia bacterium]|nr:hypothetical protein [Thermoleophilia bacterium]MCZ4496991.1 hypothetical protein [Thermoleophilia bacterium]
MAVRTSGPSNSSRSVLGMAAIGLVGVGIVAIATVPRLGTILWMVAAALAITAIVRDRGSRKLWPAWTALAIVVVTAMATVPSAESRQRIEEEAGPARVAFQRSLVALEEMSAECEIGVAAACTPESLADTEAGRTARARVGTGCVDPVTLCLSQTSTRALRVEIVTKDIDSAGPLRMTLVVQPGGSRGEPTCGGIRPDVSAAAIRKACGPGIRIESAAS